MNKMLQLFRFLLPIVGLISYTHVAAQSNPINISIAVNPPYSTNFSDYISSPTQTVVTILNTSNDIQTVFLAGSVTNLTASKSVRIPSNQVPQVPPLTLQPGVRILTGNELQFLINPNSLEYNGLTQAEVLNGNLPEGLYQICLQAIDFSTLEPRSAAEPSGCSNVFQVSFVQPPLLIGPTCGGEVGFFNPQNIIFTWTPPIGLPQGSVLSYQFKLVELQPGQNAIQAILSTTVPIVNEFVNNNFLLLTALGPPLISGREYAWQIIASDLANQAVFTNQGKSEICTFRLGLPPGSNEPVQATIVYPAREIQIPFKNVPIIARYTPFSTDHRSLFANTTISSFLGTFDNIVFNQSWPLGRETFVQQQINQTPTLEQLLHVSIGRNLALSPGSSNLAKSAIQIIQAELRVTNADGTESQSNINATFETGMPAPKLNSPVRDTSVTNHLVELKFNPANFPAIIGNQNGLIPSPEILKSVIGTNPFLFVAQIEEQFKLEVSRSSNFDSILLVKYGKFNFRDTITAVRTNTALLAKLKKEIKVEHFFPDTGRYFWRVSWLRDAVDSLSSPYVTSEVGRFFIHDGIAGEAVNSSCMGTCDAPTITDRIAATSILIGDSVQIGQFILTINELTYNGPAARGKGTIRVPFMNTNLKVSFTDLQFNAAKQVFSGSAGAEYDNSSLMPNLLGVGGFKIELPNADSLREFIDSGHSIATLDPSMPIGLPLGLDKIISGERVVIAIVAASFKPERAIMAAGINIPLYGLRDLLLLALASTV
jgi:TANFOR domain-containing protein